jgi:hypothetical protein
MRNHALATLLLGPLGTGQGAVVVPAPNATADAVSVHQVAGTVDLRQQILIEPQHLQGLVGRELTALWFRRDAAYRKPVAACDATLTVEVSTAPHASTADAREDMAHNVGADRVQVFAGAVRFPASPALTGASVPWDATHAARIAFAQPFRYGGGVLCIDLAGEPTQGSVFWPADATADPVAGAVRYVGTSCHDPSVVEPSVEGRTHVVSARRLFPGSTVTSFTNATPLANAVLLVGLRELSAPVDLGPVGAPRCSLWIDPIAALPVETVSGAIVPARPSIGGWVGADLWVPPDAGLFGARFVLQWVEWSGARIATTNAAVCTIAGAMPGLGIAVVSARYQNGAPPARGRVDRNVAPVVQIELR